MSSSTFHRAALGYPAFLGELYDARCDEFIGGLSVLSSNTPSELINHVDAGHVDYDYRTSDSYEDRFKMLDVGAEIKLSLLANMLKVEASGRYFNEDKKNSLTARVNLTCKVRTCKETVNLLDRLFADHLIMDALQYKDATHVVTGILWGANVFVLTENQTSSSEEVTKVEGALRLKYMELIEGRADGKLNISEKIDAKSFAFKLIGDILLETVPQTVGEACEIVKNTPAMVKALNNGKGVPMMLTLTPLDVIRDSWKATVAIDFTLKNLEAESIVSMTHLFQDIYQVRLEVSTCFDEIDKYKEMVCEKDFHKICKLKRQLEEGEAGLRDDMQDALRMIRSGKPNAPKLDRIRRMFLQSETAPLVIKEQLADLKEALDKIRFIRVLKAKGAFYCKGELALQSAVPVGTPDTDYFIYCQGTEDIYGTQSKGHMNAFLYLTSSLPPSESTRFVFLDLDSSAESFISHSKGLLKVTSSDKDITPRLIYEMSNNFAKTNCSDPKRRRPNRRCFAKLPCPKFFWSNGTGCNSEKNKWTCKTCDAFLDYGFDGHFYCACGAAPIHSFEFKCCCDVHGPRYEKFPGDYLTCLVNELREVQTINILLLGQTGGGKSTWVNGLANYLNYNKFDEALQEKPIFLIPAKFTMQSAKTSQKVEIHIEPTYLDSENKKNNDRAQKFTENLNGGGVSATTEPNTYVFHYGEHIVRVIDTPGIGDTRGLDQDKENFSLIMQHLQSYQELHAICILIPVNGARLDFYFEFCITEALRHLSKDVAKNIVFCFTKSRETFYQIGDSYEPLNALLKKLNVEELCLSKDTMYFFDNEAVRLLAAIKQGENFSPEQIGSFRGSWDYSVTECQRLFKHIKEDLAPRMVHGILSLNSTRALISALEKPIADINVNISEKLDKFNRKRDKISKIKASIFHNEKVSEIRVLDLELTDLEKPRTVCTSVKCTETVVSFNGYSNIVYKTICHKDCQCQLKNLGPSIPQPALKGCWAFENSIDKCRVCGCSWKVHMHIYYETVKKETKYPLQVVLTQIAIEKRTLSAKENTLLSLKTLIKEHEEEKDTISKAASEFAVFLKQNSITAFNDSFEGYFQRLIDREKDVAKADPKTSNNLKVYEELLREHKAQIKLFEDYINSGKSKANELTPKDVAAKAEQLYKLKHSGQKIRDAVQNMLISKLANTQAFERICPHPTKYKYHKQMASNQTMQPSDKKSCSMM